MIETNIGTFLSNEFLSNYFRHLVDSFFKILPMKENKEPSLLSYMENLKTELLGNKELINSLNNSPEFLSLLGRLQYIIDDEKNGGNMEFKRFRSNVFGAISICNLLSSRFKEMCVREVE